MDEVKRDNFKRIAEKRVSRIIELISKLNNLNNLSFYQYTDDEIQHIFDAIQEELDRQRESFKDKGRNSKKGFEL